MRLNTRCVQFATKYSMNLLQTKPFTLAERRKASEKLAVQITPNCDYYFLVIGAVGLALGGLFLDSSVVLIGAMIVAPLAYPILGLGLGAATRSTKLFLHALLLLFVSLIVAIVLAYIGTLTFGIVRIDPVSISFMAHPILDFVIAFIAGALAAYGLVRPRVGGAMTGIGIAVSLMPPLVATGAYVADGLLSSAFQALLIFAMNVLGIFLASTLVFIVLRVPED